MKFQVPTVSSDTFTWVADQKIFVAEASDLNMPMGRVWAGFVIKSAKTGRELTVMLDTEQRDTEGDIHSWLFRPIVKRDLFAVLVFND